MNKLVLLCECQVAPLVKNLLSNKIYKIRSLPTLKNQLIS